MATGLIDIIKRASLDAVNNTQMCDLRYGTVVNTSPLKVQVTNQFTIPSSLLIVPKHLTDYEVECTISQPSKSVSGETEISNRLESESNAISEHTHPFNVTMSAETFRTKIIMHNALKVGDMVALLRKQGGQSYFILDRI